MANPFAGQAKGSSRSKYKSMLGKSSKGQTYDGQSQSKYFGSSGNVAGGDNERVGGATSSPRADRYARGGRTKGTKININIGSNPQGENRALPPSLTPGALGPAAAMAPPGLSPPPVAMLGGGAPMKRGGRVAKAAGGGVKYTGGAETGVGRLQKAKAAK